MLIEFSGDLGAVLRTSTEYSVINRVCELFHLVYFRLTRQLQQEVRNIGKTKIIEREDLLVDTEPFSYCDHTGYSIINTKKFENVSVLL